MAVILRYVPQEDAAQDILQETFIRAFSVLPQFTWKGTGSAAAWLRRIAVNKALNYMRDNRLIDTALREPFEALPLEEEPPDAQEVAMIDEQTILAMVGQLPTGYRTVFNLYCIEGLSHKQIAERLGINEKSSSSQLARAKAILAKRIKQYLKDNES